MTFQHVTPLTAIPERRRFGRINIFEPRRCHIHLPQSPELWTDQGILVNISLGGLYFVCDRQPPLEKDDIHYLTFDAPYADSENHYLGFHGLVVRTEHRQLHLSKFGVALKIISDPIYYAPQETNKREFTSLDKPRMMYQYYDLNKKAHEIIANMPDIRTGKIRDVKKYLEKGSYQVESEKISQRVIKDLFIEKIMLSKT
jgi:anti-sigma28 factor (negative regulator of flagellin synthesis)